MIAPEAVPAIPTEVATEAQAVVATEAVVADMTTEAAADKE